MSSQLKTVLIDLEFAEHYGINLNLAAVYNAIQFTPTYCDARTINGKTYYFVSRNMMCEKLRPITSKPDTMYRYYNKLELAGLVITKKVGLQDWLHIEPGPASEWNAEKPAGYLGQTSEPRMNVRVSSDEHPSFPGQTSDIDRDILNRDTLTIGRVGKESASLQILIDQEPPTPEQIDDLLPQSGSEEKEKNSAQKEKDGPVTTETARRRDAAIRTLQGQPPVVIDEIKTAPAPLTIQEATDAIMAEIETDDGQRKLKFAAARGGVKQMPANMYAAVARYAEHQAERGHSIHSDPITKLGGYLKNQASKEAKQTETQNYYDKQRTGKRSTRNNTPAVSEATTIQAAAELRYERIHGTSALGI